MIRQALVISLISLIQPLRKQQASEVIMSGQQMDVSIPC